MKTITAFAAAAIALLPATLPAERDGHHGAPEWAEKAARGYEEKAKWAEKEGMPRAAEIFRRMAEIKREAGRASQSGKDYNWAEYHELEGKVQQIMKERHQQGENCDRKEQPGDGFMRAAEDYRRQARMARENGDTDKAQILMQLAEIKMAAARAANEGKEFDWTRYHELKKKLECGDKPGEHKPDENRPHDKPREDWHPEKRPEPPVGGGGGKLNIE